MRIKSFLNNMKEPIYKDDLKRVLINGSLYTILFGILAGAVQFFSEVYIGLTMGIFVFFIAYMIAKKINESFFTFHLLYPIISVLLFVVGFLIYNFTKLFFLFRNFQLVFQMIFSLAGLNYMFGFLNVMNYSGINILYCLIDLLIFFSSIGCAWQMVYRQK